jgi:hypothetical protein
MIIWFLLVVLAVVVAALTRKWIRSKREGFSVKTKGNADGGDVIYDEDGKLLTFYFDRSSRRIYVPSDGKWEEEMPAWAKGRKREIVDRINKRMGRDWAFENKLD